MGTNLNKFKFKLFRIQNMTGKFKMLKTCFKAVDKY
jgi:hypothetical protein